MREIKLKKKIRTKKPNNSFSITLTANKISKPIGGYDQSNNKLILDIQTYILAIKKGYTFSGSFKKIFQKTTQNLTNQKNLRIKF
jgi:hypothetical protein